MLVVLPNCFRPENRLHQAPLDFFLYGRDPIHPDVLYGLALENLGSILMSQTTQ